MSLLGMIVAVVNVCNLQLCTRCQRVQLAAVLQITLPCISFLSSVGFPAPLSDDRKLVSEACKTRTHFQIVFCVYI